MWRKRIDADERVPLKLTAAERKLVTDELMFLDQEYEAMLKNTSANMPVMMTLDELDNLGGYIAAEANHTQDKKLQKRLDRIFEKTQDLLDKYTDEKGRDATSIEDGRRRFGKAMASLTSGNEPAVIAFKLKPRAKQAEARKCPVKLTELQREALVSCKRLQAAIKRKINQAAPGTQTVELTRKELDHVHKELATAVAHAPSKEKKRLMAVQKKVTDLWEEEQPDTSGVERPKRTQRPATESDLLLQLKIALLDIEPPIWRRIQVQDCTLARLHEHIQDAMGWEDCHMHQFTIGGVGYGTRTPQDFGSGAEIKDETGLCLSEVVPKSGKRFCFSYEYDFGDDWRHEVLFEGCPDIDRKRKYPLCLEGERACPPEDVGGPWGYAEFLAAMADPDHEQHEELVEWRGPFDPEAFDAKKATREMRRVE